MRLIITLRCININLIPNVTVRSLLKCHRHLRHLFCLSFANTSNLLKLHFCINYHLRRVTSLVTSVNDLMRTLKPNNDKLSALESLLAFDNFVTYTNTVHDCTTLFYRENVLQNAYVDIFFNLELKPT